MKKRIFKFLSLFGLVKTAKKKPGTPLKKAANPLNSEEPYNQRHGELGRGCVVKYKDKFVIGMGSTYNDYCWFNARYGITIGNNTLIGPYVLIHSANHVIKNIEIEQNASGPGSWCEEDINLRITGEPVIIGNDVWIGANVTVLAGSVIPDKCVVGAGCIITKSNSRRLSRGDIVVSDIKLRVIGNRTNYE